MNEKKEVVREINEKKIMEAAELIFANYGFKGATTKLISQKAGVPKANLHYYFKTKELLYRRVLERILNEWINAAQAFDEFEEPGLALTKYVESKMNYSRTRPYASKVWANEMVHGAPVVSEFLETTLKKWLDDRVKVIKRWIRLGKIDRVDPTAFIYMIWSVTQHYADFETQMQILNNGKTYTDKEYKQKTNQVVKMILASVGLNN